MHLSTSSMEVILHTLLTSFSFLIFMRALFRHTELTTEALFHPACLHKGVEFDRITQRPTERANLSTAPYFRRVNPSYGNAVVSNETAVSLRPWFPFGEREGEVCDWIVWWREISGEHWARHVFYIKAYPERSDLNHRIFFLAWGQEVAAMFGMAHNHTTLTIYAVYILCKSLCFLYA